jgi:hypothetical protein
MPTISALRLLAPPHRIASTVSPEDAPDSRCGSISPSSIRDGLEAMALSFQPLAVARAVVRAANVELALLPRELQLVKSASVEFLKSRSLRP